MERRSKDGAAPGGSTDERRVSRESAETKDFIDRARRSSLCGACDEAIGWYDRALLALIRNGPSPDLADVLRWKGTVHAECGDTSEADRLYRESGAVAVAAHYIGGEAHALNCRATIAHRRGELAVAESLYQQAIATASGDVRLGSMILRNLGVIAATRGHLDLAVVRFLESYDKAREIGDDDGQCKALHNVAAAYLDGGRFADAERTFATAIKLARKRGDRAAECGCRINRCEAMIGLGKLADAEVECMAALGIADWRGDRLRRAEGLKVLAIIARHRGRDTEAESLLDEAFDLTVAGEDALLGAQLRREKGEIHRMRKQTSQAVRMFRDARDIYKRVGATLHILALDRLIAGIEANQGSPSSSSTSPPPARPNPPLAS